MKNKINLILILTALIFPFMTFGQESDTIVFTTKVKESNIMQGFTMIKLNPDNSFKIIQFSFLGNNQATFGFDTLGTWEYSGEDLILLDFKNSDGEITKTKKLLYSEKGARVIEEINGKEKKGMKLVRSKQRN